jgi:restriction system protein
VASWWAVSADTYYEVLGVEADASQDDIKAAYRRLSRQVHPDQGGSGALFRKVTEAYETLSDPARRAAYDDSLRAPRGQPEPGEPPEEAPGWVRVDDVAPGWPGPHDTAPPPARSPDLGADGNSPGDQAGARSGIGRLFALHPEGFLVGLGVLLIVLPGSLGPGGGTSLGSLGFLVALVGVVALVGSRRVVRSGRLLGSAVADIDAMTGPQFESVLEALFTKSGWRVRHTGRKGDLGADLVIERAGRRTVVQAKRSAAPVGHDTVQEAVGAMALYGATGAMVVTNATFTAQAMVLARANRVVLWDRRVLFAEMRRHSLAATGGQGGPGGLLGWALLGAELRAGLPMVARAAAVVLGGLIRATVALGGLIAASATSGTRPRSRRCR